MARVILSGLPTNARVPKFVFLLKKIFKQNDFKAKFWISSLGDMPGAPLKEMTIEFDSEEDAFVGQEMLDNYSYFDNSSSQTYIISADVNIKPVEINIQDVERPQRPESRRGDKHWEMITKETSVLKCRRSRPYDRSRERYRSHSPIYNKASELDLELELLRKQRMVIEEERRLLLERKKLELIQVYGPNGVNEFTDFDEPYKSPLRRQPQPKPNQPPKRKEKVFKQKKNSIPRFVLPCKRLTDEMKPLIKSYTQNTDKGMLEKLIVLSLRKRLAVTLEFITEYLSSKEIVALYRSLYPKTTDEALIKSVLRNIEQSHMFDLENTLQKDEAQDEIARKSSTENMDKDDKATPSESSKLNVDLDVTVKDLENLESKNVNDELVINGNENLKAKGEENTNVVETEFEADTTKANVDNDQKLEDTKKVYAKTALKTTENDLTDLDVTSSVADDELKFNSDELDNEDIEDWIDTGDDWIEN